MSINFKHHRQLRRLMDQQKVKDAAPDLLLFCENRDDTDIYNYKTTIGNRSRSGFYSDAPCRVVFRD